MAEQRHTQDRIIEDAIEKSRELTIYLKSGTSVKGRVVAHDSYTILMQGESNQMVVYKHFITSVYPARIPRPE